MKYFEYILSVGLKYKQIVDLMVTSWLLSCVCACFHESQPIKRLFKGHLAFSSGWRPVPDSTD